MSEINLVDRRFKLWFYQVSHSEAIIRSPKDDLGKKYDKNIDIYIGDIHYIEMPCVLQNLQVESASEEDHIYLSRKLGKDISTKKIIVLVADGKKFYIIASIIKFLENDLDYGELSIDSIIKNKRRYDGTNGT